MDTDGKAFEESIEYQPSCIKPNQYELSRLVGRDLEKEADILKACDQVHRKGVPNVLVSRGKEGMILSAPDRRLKAVPPLVKVDSPVGAGDSSVAGFILAHSQGKDLVDCLRLACAAGTATAQTPGTELCHQEDVEKLLPLVQISKL